MNATTHPNPGARRGKLALGVAVALGLAASVGLQFMQPSPAPAADQQLSCIEPSVRAS